MPIRMAMVAPSAAIWASARSTKMTPRSTTCTPRYAWMPVRIRLAMNGRIRNGSISIFLFGLLESFGQHSNIVIKELEVIRNFRFSSHGWHQYHHLAPGHAGNAVGRLEIEIRLDQLDLDFFPLHQIDDLNRMRRSRRDSRTRLNISHDIQTEV